MNCDDVRESLAAYALDILDPAEMTAIEEHLAGCREHDAELVELRATGLGLALLRGDPEPTASLRARIAGIPPATAGDGQASPRPARRSLWGLAAAAALVLMAFGAGWYVGSQPAQPAAERFAYAMSGGAGELVRLEGVWDAGAVTVTMRGIAPAPSGREYQLWAIRDGRWVSLGACNTDEDGWWKGDFPASVRAGDEVAVTVEPEGGSDRPSGTAILRAKF